MPVSWKTIVRVFPLAEVRGPVAVAAPRWKVVTFAQRASGVDQGAAIARQLAKIRQSWC
jgi:hypothetical protein